MFAKRLKVRNKVVFLGMVTGGPQRRGRCSSRGSALRDIFVRRVDRCSGSLGGFTIHTKKWFPRRRISGGFLGAPPISLMSCERVFGVFMSRVRRAHVRLNAAFVMRDEAISLSLSLTHSHSLYLSISISIPLSFYLSIFDP
jgi:hypothetical protein